MSLPSGPSLPSRFGGLLLVAGLAAAGLSGCTTPSAPSAAVSPASSPAVGASASATPPASPPASPSASSPERVRVLPESVLAPIHGTTYSRIKGAQQIPDEIASKPEVFEGMISRLFSRKGYPAGTVQLIRLRPGTINNATDRRESLRLFMEEYTRTKSFTPLRIGGSRVLLASNARSTGGSVAGWIRGRDLVLIFARQGVSAQKIAVVYLSGTT